MKPASQPEKERRVYERHELSGHIVVGRPTKGTTLAGTILNLSIGGCLMKLRAPSDLKADAVIEIGLHAGNLTFCTLGAVKRYDTDVAMIGIEFLNLGLEGRRNLRLLIANFKASQKKDLEPIGNFKVQCFCNAPSHVQDTEPSSVAS
jgi:hypothetical protein